MTQHGRVADTRYSCRTPAVGAGPQTFLMTFLSRGGPRSCPVEGCPGQVAMRTAMWEHFLHRNVLDTMVILEKVNLPHPQCTQYNIMVPWRALNSRQPDVSQYARGAERKRRLLAEEELRDSLERSLEACGVPLENVTTFRYMGRVLTAGDDD